MPVSIHLRLRSSFTALMAAGLVGGLMGCAATAPEVVTPEIEAPSRSSRGGIPYKVRGKVYYPLANAAGFSEEGVASWYGRKFHGRLTSSGEVFDMHSATAAHKTLPFNTRVRVVNLDNNRETEVRINDRGPFAGDRIIDLSFQAAKELGMVKSGTAHVRLTATGSPSTGSTRDTRQTYAVQLGVYRDRKNAADAVTRVHNSRLLPQETGTALLYRVLWGRNENFISAAKLKEQARWLGYGDAFIVIDPKAEKPGAPQAAANF